jgi:hypothetical protein
VEQPRFLLLELLLRQQTLLRQTRQLRQLVGHRRRRGHLWLRVVTGGQGLLHRLAYRLERRQRAARNTTEFSSCIASCVCLPDRDRVPPWPAVSNWMNPANREVAGFHCTDTIDASGMRLSPRPTVERPMNRLRLIVTQLPSN